MVVTALQRLTLRSNLEEQILRMMYERPLTGMLQGKKAR